MAAGAAVLVQRQQLAAGRFIDAVGEQFGLSAIDAGNALRAMLQAKLVRLDPIVGQFQLRDGRAWDADVMRRAALAGGQ